MLENYAYLLIVAHRESITPPNEKYKMKIKYREVLILVFLIVCILLYYSLQPMANGTSDQPESLSNKTITETKNKIVESVLTPQRYSSDKPIVSEQKKVASESKNIIIKKEESIDLEEYSRKSIENLIIALETSIINGDTNNRDQLLYAIYDSINEDKNIEHSIASQIEQLLSENIYPEHRDFLASILISIPNETVTNYGRRLIESSSAEDRNLGYDLIAGQAPTNNTSTHTKEIDNHFIQKTWLEPNSDVASTIIDTININSISSDSYSEVSQELTAIFDTHDSINVKASALVKLSAINKSQETIQRIEHALQTPNIELKQASILAITKSNISSPTIKDELISIIANPNLPSNLQDKAFNLLIDYDFTIDEIIVN